MTNTIPQPTLWAMCLVAAGAYMFRLTNGEEVKMQKVIVTNY